MLRTRNVLQKSIKREMIQKAYKVELWFLCIALGIITRNTHTEFEFILKRDDEDMLPKEMSYKNKLKGKNSKSV